MAGFNLPSNPNVIWNIFNDDLTTYDSSCGIEVNFHRDQSFNEVHQCDKNIGHIRSLLNAADPAFMKNLLDEIRTKRHNTLFSALAALVITNARYHSYVPAHPENLVKSQRKAVNSMVNSIGHPLPEESIDLLFHLKSFINIEPWQISKYITKIESTIPNEIKGQFENSLEFPMNYHFPKTCFDLLFSSSLALLSVPIRAWPEPINNWPEDDPTVYHLGVFSKIFLLTTTALSSERLSYARNKNLAVNMVDHHAFLFNLGLNSIEKIKENKNLTTKNHASAFGNPYGLPDDIREKVVNLLFPVDKTILCEINNTKENEKDHNAEDEKRQKSTTTRAFLKKYEELRYEIADRLVLNINNLDRRTEEFFKQFEPLFTRFFNPMSDVFRPIFVPEDIIHPSYFLKTNFIRNVPLFVLPIPTPLNKQDLNKFWKTKITSDKFRLPGEFDYNPFYSTGDKDFPYVTPFFLEPCAGLRIVTAGKNDPLRGPLCFVVFARPRHLFDDTFPDKITGAKRILRDKTLMKYFGTVVYRGQRWLLCHVRKPSLYDSIEIQQANHKKHVVDTCIFRYWTIQNTRYLPFIGNFNFNTTRILPVTGQFIDVVYQIYRINGKFKVKGFVSEPQR